MINQPAFSCRETVMLRQMLFHLVNCKIFRHYCLCTVVRLEANIQSEGHTEIKTYQFCNETNYCMLHNLESLSWANAQFIIR